MFPKSGIVSYLGDIILRTLVTGEREGGGRESKGRGEAEKEWKQQRETDKEEIIFTSP